MKKLITIVLIASMAITGLFAYSAPSVILAAVKAEVDYSFKLQKLNSAMSGFEDFDEGQTENVVLSSEVGTTNAFTISTIDNGNMNTEISFSAVVTTGEFEDQGSDGLDSGWYPAIVGMSESATVENLIRGNETVEYDSGHVGSFRSYSSGTFITTFTRGKHLFGTEIARFKLQYKADDDLAAGSYISTTTIDITTV